MSNGVTADPTHTNTNDTVQLSDNAPKIKADRPLSDDQHSNVASSKDANTIDNNSAIPISMDQNKMSKETIYATPLRKSDRHKTKSSASSSQDDQRHGGESTNGSRTNQVADDERHILNFIKDSTKLQKKIKMHRAAGGSGAGGGSSSGGDCDYGKSNFSSLAQEQHFVNLVQQNVIGYGKNSMLNSSGDGENTSLFKDSESELNSSANKSNSSSTSNVNEKCVSSQRFAEMPAYPMLNMHIKREWVIKVVALCLEQRYAKGGSKLPALPADEGLEGKVTDAHRRRHELPVGASRAAAKQSSQYTGCMVLGCNGSGKTSICEKILHGTSGTPGMLNRRLLCTYFINSHNPDCHSLSMFIRSVIMQVLSHSSHFSGKDESECGADNNGKSNVTELQAEAVKNDEKGEKEANEKEDTTKDAPDDDPLTKVKKQIIRQHSETLNADDKNHDSNGTTAYTTYPPLAKAPEEAAKDSDTDNTASPSKPKQTKSKTGGSKIPVKIGNKTTGSPVCTNKGPRVEDANKSTSEPEACNSKDTTAEVVDESVNYENIDAFADVAQESKKTPDAAEPSAKKVPSPENCNQPLPPPKSKSCLETIANEYYSILMQNSDILDSLNPDNIEKNPDECFKKAILYPFLELQPPKSALLFLIDSIDEQYINEEQNVITTLKGQNSNRSRTIAELLSNNIHLMPKWLFMVCTAKRQNRHIVKKFNGFKRIALDDLRKSHVVKDVQEYIIARLNTDFKGLIHFTADIIESLNQLYIKSNGSILYLEKVLSGIRENIFSFREIKLIPCTLNGLYLYICQKTFNKKQYTKIRPILNILLASSDFVELTFVLNCLRTQNYTINEAEFEKRIETMRYVLEFNPERTKVKIFHNSFGDWLSDVKFSTKKFLCNVNEGHAMIAMYNTVISETLCPNQVLKYFHHLIKTEEYLLTKNMNLDLILILLESKANLIDCFYTNSLNCCPLCELEFKNVFCSLPRMRQAIDKYLNKSLNEEISNFLGDFFKPSLPTNAKILKLLIETGINNADCQLSYDSLLNSPVLEDTNDELAELLIISEKTCQKTNAKSPLSGDNSGNEYQEIGSPRSSSPVNNRNQRDKSESDLSQPNQLLVRGKALIHMLANEGNVDLLKRALNACKKDNNGVATIDLEIEDECGQTALNIAARNGHFDIVELLLSLRYTTSGNDSSKANQTQRVSVNHADRDGWTPLRSASWGGHAEVVKLLLQHPECKIDLADKEQRTALRAAAWSGHEDILRTLIASGANVNSVDKQGRTSLIAASYMGHYEIVEILLENGANVNHLDIDGRSALCVAALCGSSGYSKVISILLEYKANTDQQDNDGMSPLLVSSFEGNTEVCELLLENGADPDLTDNMGRTPLWAACTTGHASIVKLLLFWGCSIDCMDSEGRTVLSIAAAQGNPETVRQLLDRGLDETHRDNAGWTPLHYAAFEGYDDICTQLLEAGAKIYECDNEGKNALHIAAQEGKNIVIECLLNTTNVSIDQKAHDGKTAFRLACIEGKIDCINTLIKYGADVNLRDADGRPTLYILALENNAKIAKHLLEHSNVNVNLPDNEGRTPLHVASWQGHLEMVKLLIAEACADVNSMDFDYRTPLHSCAWQGNHKVMELLLFYGATADHSCKQGATALGISAQEGHEACVAILLQYGANPNKSDHCGRTPIKLAMKSNNVNILRLLEGSANNDSSAKVAQQRPNPAHHKMVQSPPAPPEKKLPVNGTVFYENTMNSDSSSNNKQYNRKSIISSQSTGSSNNEMTPLPPPSKNYQISHSSSKQMQQQPMPGNFRSSVSSHSDIFNKVEEKLNFDLSDMSCMSPLYATPPLSPISDTNLPNFEDNFETPSAIFASHPNDHFARDTHMRIILGNNSKDSNQPSKKSSKRSGITTNPAVRLLRNRFDSAAQLIRRTNNMLSSSSSYNNQEGSSSIGIKSGTFQWRKESQM